MKRFFPLVLCLAFVLALLVFPVSAAFDFPSIDNLVAEADKPYYFVRSSSPGIATFVAFDELPILSYGSTGYDLNVGQNAVFSFLDSGCWSPLIPNGSSYTFVSDTFLYTNFDLYDSSGLLIHASDVVTGSAGSVDADGLMKSVVGGLSAFSTGNLIIIIGAVLGITVAPVLLWFGFNFAKRKLLGAMKKGRL